MLDYVDQVDSVDDTGLTLNDGRFFSFELIEHLSNQVSQVKSFNDDASVDGMWYGWAGCVRFKDGGCPVYRCIGNWLVIADGQCVQVHGQNPNDEDDFWSFEFEGVHFPNACCAISFLKGLPNDFEPEQFNCIEL